MGYRGEEDQPGGWPRQRPAQPPYGPGQSRPGSPYGQPPQPDQPRRESYDSREPYDPRESYSPREPYDPRRSDDRYSSEPPSGGYPSGRTDDLRESGNPYRSQEYGPLGRYGMEDSYGPDEPADPYGPEQSYDPGSRFAASGSHDFDGPEWRPAKSNLPLVLGGVAAAAVILIGGGVGLAVAMGGDSKATANTSPSPAGQSPSTSATGPSPASTDGPGGLAKIKTRTTDPALLTLGEVFKNKTFTEGGRRYVMTTVRGDKKCTNAVHGTKLQAALRKAGCNQVLRASFASADGKLIGTIGVANLKDVDASGASQRAFSGDDTSFLQPLPGPGATKKLGQGTALGSAEVRGHYLILTWMQYADGRKVPKSAQNAFSLFQRDVVFGSNLGPALGYRTITGKPYGS